MSIELSEQQRQAVLKGEPVRVAAPELGREIVVLSADAFDELLQDEHEQSVFRAFAREQAARLARESPY